MFLSTKLPEVSIDISWPGAEIGVQVGFKPTNVSEISLFLKALIKTVMLIKVL